jgi:mannose-6-phosphate isomerase-like protein (cupin superfamily)
MSYGKLVNWQFRKNTMFIKDTKKCEEIIAGDNTILRELLSPLKEEVSIRYSLAHAKVKPGEITYAHRLRSSEIYYILEGEGEMYIDNEKEKVFAGQIIYIPPNSIQRIKNTGMIDLIFLCIVDPAWKSEDEELVE